MDDLISEGKVTRGWLGVQIQDVDEGMAKALNLEDRNGAIISQVIQDSPAEDAGVEEQDVIVSVDGEIVDNSSKLKNLISSDRPNDKTRLTVIRDGKEKKLVVTLGVRPGEEELKETYQYGGQQFDLLGLRVESFKEESESIFSFAELTGVRVIDVKSNSSAHENNIQRGDIITEIGKTSLSDIKDYKKELDNYSLGDTIMLRVLRNGTPLYVGFEIE